ncbi:hypothetical protein WJX84_011323 [Apatococcus fuscideae]|uniref:Uncharacterized protein n=1 Tax=Apatococcus fuscideae TaxID=2026836 RepID=A0AAW1SKL3_9CHLO
MDEGDTYYLDVGDHFTDIHAHAVGACDGEILFDWVENFEDLEGGLLWQMRDSVLFVEGKPVQMLPDPDATPFHAAHLPHRKAMKCSSYGPTPLQKGTLCKIEQCQAADFRLHSAMEACQVFLHWMRCLWIV